MDDDKEEEMCEMLEVYDPEEDPGDPGLFICTHPPPPLARSPPRLVGPTLPMNGLELEATMGEEPMNGSGVETIMISIWSLQVVAKDVG